MLLKECWKKALNEKTLIISDSVLNLNILRGIIVPNMIAIYSTLSKRLYFLICRIRVRKDLETNPRYKLSALKKVEQVYLGENDYNQFNYCRIKQL